MTLPDFSRFSLLAPPLLDWYDKNARTLPWRSDPTPYHVLVSEIMLQQTRVEAVREHYLRFIDALPDLAALAVCPEEKLLKLWQGLGYYSRAKNLQRAAAEILQKHNGIVPRDPGTLRTLPGIGDYCAGSVSSIAYGVRAPAVDGNVLRVMARLSLYDGDVTKPASRRELTKWTEKALPSDRCGDFNQALMELGALVCLPNGAPLCTVCPLAALCAGRESGMAADLPKKSPKKQRRVETLGVLLLRYHGAIALEKRPAGGLLAGMWGLPVFSGEAAQFLRQNGIDADPPVEGKSTRHIFTHVEWHMTAWECEAASPSLPENWVFAEERELAERYAVASAFSPFLFRQQKSPRT